MSAASVRSWVFCDYTPLDSVGSPTMGLMERERALITRRWKLRRKGDSLEQLYDLLRDFYQQDTASRKGS